MMWDCIGWNGIGHACKIDGKMDADLYVQMLEDELQLSLNDQDKTPAKVVFQQDNDPNILAKRLKHHDFDIMNWPAQFPDLNPIEHIWSHLKRKLAAYLELPKGVTELQVRIEKEWEAIDTSVCQDLIGSMPRRVEAVLKAKGGYTKYQVIQST